MATSSKTRKKKPTKKPLAERGQIVHSEIMKLFPFYRSNFFVTYSTVQHEVSIIEPNISKKSLKVSDKAKNEFVRLIRLRALNWQCLTILFKEDGNHITTAHSLASKTMAEAVSECADFSKTGIEQLYDVGGELEHEQVCRWGLVLTPSWDVDILEAYHNSVEYFENLNIMSDSLTELTDEICLLKASIANDKAQLK